MLNRALIPLGLHHALNAVFWFDVAGINDLGKFWSGEVRCPWTDRYVYDRFLPDHDVWSSCRCSCNVSYRKDSKEKGSSFPSDGWRYCFLFTGITEPLEFSSCLSAPGLYLVHAVLTGISAIVCTLLPVRCGFNFSAGLVDYILSFKAPMAENPLLTVLDRSCIRRTYYFVFKFCILHFNLKTPGREDDDDEATEMKIELADNDFTAMAARILEGLGGKDNLTDVDYCATRIRTEIKDYTAVDEKVIKSAGVAGVVRPSQKTVQVVVGPKVQFVYDEMKKMM